MIEQSSRDLVEEMRWQLGKIRDREAANEELLGKLDEAKQQLAALEARVSSPDGRVTVAAGSGGIVRSVELAENAMNTNAKTLTATINATVQAAIAEATGKQLEIVRAQVADDVDPVRILGPQAKFASFGNTAITSDTGVAVQEQSRPAAEGDDDAFHDPLADDEPDRAPTWSAPAEDTSHSDDEDEFHQRLGLDHR